jgi:peptidoglycan/xylan/chitin deacetylase (PgdA/CDA1 family)
VSVIRHLLAPHCPACARALEIPLTLTQAGFGDPTGIAVTFDDGPHPEGTPAVLEVLAAHRARATFFLVGEQVRRRPELVRRIAEAGHAIALHGYRHRLLMRLTSAQIEDDIARGLAAIEDAVGLTPQLHRAPYGIYSATALRVGRGPDLQPLLWSVWGKDWRRFTTADRIAARAVAGRRAGDVLLLHDADFYSAKNSYRHTVGALPMILTMLRSAGLATVPAAR